ncbi:MAG TPA: hypothetical protein VJ927_12055 [Actinomycetota bacterium]|nr:hypothetical protein [Actinomycetota bacterium]
MRFKALVSVLTLVMAASVLVAGPAGAEQAAKKRTGPQVLGTDDAGDWGCNQDCTLAPLAAVLGQDLVGASIGMADPKTLNFIIAVDSLPPTGGIPEFSRYTWEFAVDGEALQLSGAFTEYLRGICNPTYNPTICPPPRDPGMSPFFIRKGGCTVGGPCEEVALVHATFDAATATITIPVPMKAVGARTGSKITPGASLFGGAIYAAPAAFVTQATLPADTMMISKTYVVPKG